MPEKRRSALKPKTYVYEAGMRKISYHKIITDLKKQVKKNKSALSKLKKKLSKRK